MFEENLKRAYYEMQKAYKQPFGKACFMSFNEGCHFCVRKENVITYEWMAQLHPPNAVYRAELLAIREVCLWASETIQPVKVWLDSVSSLHSIATINSKSPIAQEIQEIMLKFTNIKLGWISAHVGHSGNEAADELTKKATQSGTPAYIPSPRTHVKSYLQSISIIRWQPDWDKGETGRTVHNVLPKV